MFGFQLRPGRTVPAVASSVAAQVLFRNGEQGVIYDPNDLSTLFQDSAGTTPVTAAGQPVGLMLDKSRGLVQGSELYAGGSTGWTAGAEWLISGDTASVVGTGSFTNLDKTVSGTASNKFYTLVLEVISVAGGALRVALGGSTFVLITSPGTYRLQLNTTTSSGLIRMQAGSGITATVRISNPSVRELPGNHAFQPTAASRPMLRQTPILGNELAVNGDFSSSAGWALPAGTSTTGGKLQFASAGTTLTASSAAQIDNGKEYSITYTIDSISGGGVRVIVYGNGSFGLGSGRTSPGTYTETITISSAGGALNDSLAISTTVAGTVATIDNISVKEVTGYYTDRNYLETDGSDDWMQTNAIDFTGTDKVSVFAGVRKLSDAATGILCELSANAGSNNGAFWLAAPGNSGLPNYSCLSRGSANSTAVLPSIFGAPITNVLTVSCSIAGDSILARANGAQVATSSSDQGTGTYGSHALYLFRRGGTTLPFSGHFYGLIIVGRLCTAAETRNVERWMANRTGVVLA